MNKKAPKNRVKVDKIIKYMQDNKLSKTQFAKMCGISIYALNTILDDNKNYLAFKLAKVAQAMHIKLDGLINF